MEYFWWLFLATRLDSISTFFGWMTVLSFLMVIIAWVCIMVGYGMLEPGAVASKSPQEIAELQEFRTKMYPWRRWGIACFLTFAALYSFTPTKQDALFIAGGVGIIEGTKALQGSEIAKKSVLVVEQWLENNLTELQKQKEGLLGEKK